VTIAFFLDHNVPITIANQLRHRRIDVVTAFEQGTSAWDDESLLRYSWEQSRCFVTLDTDFLKITSDWLENGIEFSGVVFIHQRVTSLGEIVEDLNLIAETFTQDELRNQIFYVPLCAATGQSP